MSSCSYSLSMCSFYPDGSPNAASGRGMTTVTAREPAISVEDLVKIYPAGTAALGGVSFTVDRGEIFGFLGPNGSGKTTTVRILVTLLRKSQGTALVGGFDTEREAQGCVG
jgi:ABC-type multidrug transport system ATPase subunit